MSEYYTQIDSHTVEFCGERMSDREFVWKLRQILKEMGHECCECADCCDKG